ncbi:MAG TPA: hypothetical protein VNS09_09105 [Solirubrobacter sp.]|nr:hypothetical protein [Solirubrobacter sp.]
MNGSFKQRLREQSEHYLLQDSVRRLGHGVPGTVEPYDAPEGRAWRLLFVPLYKRLPWGVKQRAMTTLRMTASGWTPPRREPGEPWKPPHRQ